jgi:hydrogenase maturation factor
MAPLGKIPADVLARVVVPQLGAHREEVLVGPRVGTDAAIARVSAGRVLAVTTDPLSLVPELGPERSGKLACHLIASDLWTTGIPPAFASVCLNLPPDLSDETLERYLRAMHEAWSALDIAVVTGHTGRYEGCEPVIIGAATLMGLGDEGRYVGPPFVAEGDRVIVTKSCAMEAAAFAACAFPKRYAARLPDGALERLQQSIERVSVVQDCQVALRTGVRDAGVSLLHDATEGGVVGGLFEVACSIGRDLRIERARLPLDDDVRAMCAALDIDPYVAPAEGALIALVRPDRAQAALEEFEQAGIAAADVGEVVGGEGRLWVTESDGSVMHLDKSPPDPWWPLWQRGTSEGWS